MPDEPVDFNSYHCETCTLKKVLSDDHAFSFVGMKQHLKEVHGINTLNSVFTTSMVSHLDGSDYYISVYKLHNDVVDILQTIKMRRERSDPMRH